MIGCLRPRVRKQPISALYFESENELSFISSRTGAQCEDYLAFVNREQYMEIMSEILVMLYHSYFYARMQKTRKYSLGDGGDPDVFFLLFSRQSISLWAVRTSIEKQLDQWGILTNFSKEI